MKPAGKSAVKRILFLFKGLARGGAEQLLLNGAPYHDTSEFEYSAAYVLPSKNALVGELRAAGMRVFCLDGERGAGWMARLRRLVEREGIDLVHSHSPYAAVGARMALGRRNPKHVYTEHSDWELHHRATYVANLATLWRNDHVFAVSHHVAESMRYPKPFRFLPMPTVEVLYHGIDFASVDSWAVGNGIREEFGLAPDAPLIGSVSNFEPRKGQEYLLEALSDVRRQLPSVRALLVGQGRFESDIRRMARRLGLDQTVVFAGYRADAPRIAGAFDVFVLASINEGLSIALIEAMAQGKASVVTDAGGLPEVLRDGVEGLVVPARSPRALADGMVALLTDRGLRERLGKAARSRARSFDIRRAVRRMEQVYSELLA